MQYNFFDKIVEVFSPSTAINRIKQRAAIENLKLKAGIRKYAGASQGRTAGDWNATSASSNVEIQSDLVRLRNRSRELSRDNDYIKNWLRVMPNNIIGTGIIPEPKIVGRSGNATRIKEVWKLWAEDVKCDYDQRFDFYGLQHLIVKTVMQSGECLVVRRRAKSKYQIPVRIQILEGDFIDNSKFSLSNEYGGVTWYGVEFNQDGERVGYWLWNRHPGEFATQSSRIDAKDIIHIFSPDRPGQVKGVPESHSTISTTKNLDEYEIAEMTRAKVASCMVGAIEQDAEAGNDDLASSFETMEPGTMQRLRKGERVSFNTVPSSNGYSDYISKNLHSIAAGLGITYESLTNDYSQVNFSSGRMGWLEFSRNIAYWQNFIIKPACNIMFSWFVEAAQVSGNISLTAMVRADWTPPRREMIDPSKEIKALSEEVRNKFKTWHEAVRERGDNPEDVLSELKSELKLFKDAGLLPESFPEFDPENNGSVPVNDKKGSKMDTNVIE